MLWAKVVWPCPVFEGGNPVFKGFDMYPINWRPGFFVATSIVGWFPITWDIIFAKSNELPKLWTKKCFVSHWRWGGHLGGSKSVSCVTYSCAVKFNCTFPRFQATAALLQHVIFPRYHWQYLHWFRRTLCVLPDKPPWWSQHAVVYATVLQHPFLSSRRFHWSCRSFVSISHSGYVLAPSITKSLLYIAWSMPNALLMLLVLLV